MSPSVDVERAGWNPWRSLREREHIVFALDPAAALTGGAFYWPRGDRAVIVIDASLGRIHRNAALAHELCHEDLPGASEQTVDDEVARRLVPFDELAALWQIAVLNDLPCEAWMIAERFDVPDDVAERAMKLFLGESH